jgi:hypothetical protein
VNQAGETLVLRVSGSFLQPRSGVEEEWIQVLGRSKCGRSNRRQRTDRWPRFAGAVAGLRWVIVSKILFRGKAEKYPPEDGLRRRLELYTL